VVVDSVGVGSVDFWGISFSPSSIEGEPMHAAELDRKIRLLQGCWSYFDGVAARVSAQMQKGPTGDGRDRDQIIRHTVRSESFAKRSGLRGLRVMPRVRSCGGEGTRRRCRTAGHPSKSPPARRRIPGRWNTSPPSAGR
jgi:hypothetical protein